MVPEFTILIIDSIADYISPEEQLAVQQTVQENLGNIDPYEFLAALWNEAYGKGTSIADTNSKTTHVTLNKLLGHNVFEI